MMKTFKFDEIAYNSTQKVKPTEADKEHYIGLEHIDGECLYISRWGADVAPIGEKLVMRKGDVLFGKRRAYQRKVAIAPIDGIFSAHGLVLRPKEDVVDKDYFPFFMSSNQFLDRAIQISVGGLSPTINWKDLARQEFTLPSLSEQKVLADKLWAAYRVKESYKKLLAATDDMLKAKFMEMKNAASQMVSLSTICFVQKGSNLTRNNAIDGIYPVVAGGQIPSCYHNTYNREGHVISVSASGAYAGFVNYWKNPIYASDCNTIISKSGDIVETYFVYLGLKAMQNEVYKLQKGGAQPHVYGSDLELFSFPIIEKKLQQQFVEIATQAEATKESLRKSIENIDQVISISNNAHG